MKQTQRVIVAKAPFDDDKSAASDKDRARLRLAALDIACRCTEVRAPEAALEAAKKVHAWVVEGLADEFSRAPAG